MNEAEAGTAIQARDEHAGRQGAHDKTKPRREGPHLSIGSWHMPLPKSKWLRVLVGILLLVCGLLGFLPILGFWMIPLGLVVLSHDSSYIRRKRRRMAVWWGRRQQAKKAAKA